MNYITRHLLITGGGTGGHIFPGIAVANYLIKKKGWKVSWLGSIGHLEAEIVPKHGIEIEFIRAIGFFGGNYYRRIMALSYLCSSILKAREILCDWKPDIVLGVGGYVSASVGIAAWICGYPMILHEQNAIAGFTNRFLSMTVAKKVLQAFPGVFPRGETVGNPIRDVILEIKNPEDRLYNRIGPIRLLVIGGSQGAQILNQILPKVGLIFLNQIIIWHQVGKGNVQEVSHSYGSSIKNVYKLVEFIEDIATAYAWADIVICRCGALTVSEIACVGLPAIFVPFIHRDNHQYWNAFPLQKIGAAKIINEWEFTVNHVSQILYSWNDRHVLLRMARLAKLLGEPNATKYVAYKIISQVTCQ